MPFYNGVRLHEDQCIGPFRPSTAECYPERLVGVLDFRPGTFIPENSKLLPQSEILDPEVVIGFEE